jgi:phage baseplate assembly protein W
MQIHCYGRLNEHWLIQGVSGGGRQSKRRRKRLQSHEGRVGLVKVTASMMSSGQRLHLQHRQEEGGVRRG